MEDMEEDRFDLHDDHNHNYCSNGAHLFLRTKMSDASQPQPVSPVPCIRGNHEKVGSSTIGSKFMDLDSTSESCSEIYSHASSALAGTLTLNSASKFLMNAMTEEDYRNIYWPNLEKAIDHLLVQNPMDHISISYEQIYSYVYKCVCQQHSELLYKDLMSKITIHLQQVCSDLQISPQENFIENFNLALTQYTVALQCIVPVFIYMNKFYIETKLNRDLREDLMKLFCDHVAEKHLNTLIPLLIKAHSVPFQVRPSTMASVVKGLYSLKPEWAQAAPALFSGFIPQINPPAVESKLSDYAAHDQKLQMELSLKGFSRGDQSRKRASEESP